MPPRPNRTYKYQETDDPVTVANQFGVSPQQLLAANPGGSPFSIGQTINVPFQYAAPIGPAPAPATIGPQPPIGPQRPPFEDEIPNLPQAPANYPSSGNRGMFSYNNPYAYGTDDSWYRTAAQTQAARQAQRRLDTGQPAPAGTPGASGAPTLAGGDFYGYERDPVTGRSERVVKNSATSNFLKELRWDPQTRKYVSIGRLLKQGKLDLKGNWNSTGRRQRQNANLERKKKQQQTQQDFTLSNSLISFGASSG